MLIILLSDAVKGEKKARQFDFMEMFEQTRKAALERNPVAGLLSLYQLDIVDLIILSPGKRKLAVHLLMVLSFCVHIDNQPKQPSDEEESDSDESDSEATVLPKLPTPQISDLFKRSQKKGKDTM